MTSMMTDYEVVNLEQFELERDCTPWGIPCGRPAKWIGITPCCGHELPVCNAHKLIINNFHSYAKAQGTSGKCRVCDANVDWDDFRWERL